MWSLGSLRWGVGFSLVGQSGGGSSGSGAWEKVYRGEKGLSGSQQGKECFGSGYRAMEEHRRMTGFLGISKGEDQKPQAQEMGLYQKVRSDGRRSIIKNKKKTTSKKQTLEGGGKGEEGPEICDDSHPKKGTAQGTAKEKCPRGGEGERGTKRGANSQIV